jgi:hypothetical protein
MNGLKLTMNGLKLTMNGFPFALSLSKGSTVKGNGKR